MRPAPLELEAQIFSRYLLGIDVPKAARELYVTAITSAATHVSANDKKLLALTVRRPWLTGCVDGGLVFIRPNSEVRRRLYIMLSILETVPELADQFLPKRRSVWYVFWLAFVGVRACLRAGVGIVLVKVIGS